MLKNSLRAGFSMLEMVVGMAILVILAAVVVPSTIGYSRAQDIRSTATTFNEISDSVKSFKTVITMYPSRLSHLGTVILGTDLNSCSAAYTNTNNVKWINPFWDVVIPIQGLKLPIGTANNVMVRTSPSGTAGFLQIQVPSVPYDIALDMNVEMDGPNDPIISRSSTTGMIRYGVPDAQELVQLTYNISVAKTC